ncbi:MAG: glycosyltransferase family 4 protein [Prevotellaceae bacterium]|jgi:glycosyltransferase involved in cell wall biosynthesis|nr:glycosyltransferase family 4 protein [Prevotellaceae bacterium]
MKIAIEAQRIFRPHKHGMDFVVLETIRELQKRDDGNEYYIITAPGEDRCLEETHNLSVVEVACPTYPLWEQVALPQVVRRLGADLLHCTSNTAPIRCAVPLVLTLHDIIYLTTPKERSMSRYQQMGWYYRRWNVPRVLPACKRIITVSETERLNILHRFPTLTDRLSVVYNGFGKQYHLLTDAESITRKYLPERPYLFFLGNTDPRKNTLGVLRAYNNYLTRSSRKQKLVITGLKKPEVEALLNIHSLKACAPYLVYTGYVPGNDLPALYNGAFAFLCPSLAEGFGIPLLESMACGTPVITSNLSAMPEIAGEGGILIDPHNPQAVADALLRLENDDAYYQQQVTYGLERATHFSWAKTATAYAEIYGTLKLEK